MQSLIQVADGNWSRLISAELYTRQSRIKIELCGLIK